MSEHEVHYNETPFGCWAICSCGWLGHVRVGHGMDAVGEAQELYRRHVTNVGWRA